MDRIQVIGSESARLAEVVAQADPSARVPTCPDWDAKALLWHLTGVHRFWADVLAQNPQTDDEVGALEQEGVEPPGAIAEILPLREQATADLLVQLGELNDHERRWSWWEPDQTVGFTRRMQTYEATMHRIDAELAAGVPVSAIADDVAVGAVDHCVDVMWGWMPNWAQYEELAVVELVASDASNRWLVEIGHWFGTGPESGNTFDMARATRAPESAAATATVSGTAEQLSRWAWGRRPEEDAVTVEGTTEARAAIARLIEQGIQ
ncbi:maleylpyruvate isomerase family mycothiol-dependent enzyme [Pseudactinotalea sp.]|uniref:maleylpyruvate isomerase family mycothiol-dependent enzyme n=1 Tax=Pseudactinotalea sp. TaxID=1926260 RepID=UPI003B3ACD44